MEKTLKYIIYVSLALLYMTLCLVTMLYIAYYIRVDERKMSGSSINLEQHLVSLKYLDKDTYLQLGWLNDGRTGQFNQFLPLKKDGVIRIGALGGSFTWGSEINDKQDWPYLLQKKFKEAGMKNVEVINFGSGAYGFFQTYLLWDKVASQFDLDFILLGPASFAPERDSSFKAFTSGPPLLLHARYILDKNNEIKFVGLQGKDHQEQTKIYTQFIPPMDYILYDSRPPAFAMGVLPKDRDFRNPFYYRYNDIESEIYEIYTQLLKKISNNSQQIILFDENEYLRRKISSVTNNISANSNKFLWTELYSFPYRRIVHFGTMGTEVVAQMFFDVITGKKESEFQKLEIQPVNPKIISPQSIFNLSDIDRIHIQTNRKEFGDFQELSSFAENHTLNSGEALLKEIKNGASMAIITNQGFCPFLFSLPKKISPEDKIFLSFGEKENVWPLNVAQLSQSPNIVALSFQTKPLDCPQPEKAQRVSLTIESLNTSKERHKEIPTWTIMAPAEGVLSPQAISDKEDLYLTLSLHSGKTHKILIGHSHWKKLNFTWSENGLRKIIVRKENQGEILEKNGRGDWI